jgi:hypothetical protein
VTDESSFIQKVLIDLLDWPIDPKIKTVEEIAYDWTKDELRAADLDKKVVEGRIRQLALPDCPWGIFIVEFKNPDVFQSGRGMTVPLRQVLSGLVPKRQKSANLPSFFRAHLLFICTHHYQYFRFVHFKEPGAQFKQPPLASFGWWPGDSTKTVSTYNLPHLAFLDPSATVDDWIDEWTAAFDVERVTKKFYTDYKEIHSLFQEKLVGVPAADRAWLASVLLNRLMFVYFLQKKAFIDGGNESYLEDKLRASKGKDKFYTDFLALLFFEGFAKPKEKRSAEAKAKLGEIRYLNGGLFLHHPIEERAAKAGKTISLPDSVFHQLFKLFGSFSWNLNDKPGGQDNEINPDVLGYIVEKYINQKAFGAYYTRPEITGYLCERTIHRLILDAVNTPEGIIESSKKIGLPIRSFKSVGDLLKKLDPPLASKLLNDVLPGLALLDPACGSGAFLVAAMKTLIDIYAAVFGWIKFNGSPALKTRLKKIEDEHASLDYFIKKRIITDNLFGVDIMEEAVEIARLRLFLALAASANTVEELEPLPNIDFNILRGNSLIGLMHVDGKGFNQKVQKTLFDLPPYEQVLRDRDRQLHVYRNTAEYMDDLTALRDKITEVNAQAQHTLDEILLDDFHELGIKYQQATWDDKKGAEGKPQKRPLNLEDIQALHPFHWAFAFDKVMARGGFDAIITNPPWEVLKPYAKEFFQRHSELVTKLFMPIEEFEKEKAKLLKDASIRTAWLEYLSGFAYQSAWFRSTTQYEKQISLINGKKAGTDVNLYKLFVEQCFNLLRDGGRCGILTPGSIYNDLGAKRLRQMLFEQCQVDSLFGLTNERFMFEGLDHRFKVCILSFCKAGSTTRFPAAFRIQPREAIWPEELDDFFHNPDEHLILSVQMIRKLSPDSLSLMEFKNERDLAIAEKLARFPMLGERRDDWWRVRFVTEFHMNNDSDLFESSPAKGRVPLLEGKMIHQFNAAFGKPKYWIDELAARKRLLGKESDSGQKLAYQNYRLGFRDVARNSDERTTIMTMLPPAVFCPHTMPTAHVMPKGSLNPDHRHELFFCALANSLVVDWILRQKVNAHLTFFLLNQTPIPRLVAAERAFDAIVWRSAQLSCNGDSFDSLSTLVGLAQSDRVAEPSKRAKLRAELDAMIAHLYRLTEVEFAHILSTFPIVPEETKQAALDEFIRMRESGEAAVFNPDLAKPAAAVVDPAKAVKDLIAAGESALVEFKPTARWDMWNSTPDKKMERKIVKSVAAMLNTAGGTLVIGVEDDGKVYGLAEDYKLSGSKGRDTFELWLTQMLMKDFGKDVAGLLAVAFYELKPPETDKLGSGDVCVVTVKPSPKPRFLVEESQERFFIRTGNATNSLKMSEFLEYCKHRWPEGAAIAPA